MADPELLALLETGTRRLVRTVDAMSDEQWAAPSLLPDWSRGHVVAHLALNAEAMSGALEGVHEGRPVPMYPSDEARDAAIDALSTEAPSVVRDRFLGSSTVVYEWIAELADNLLNVPIERVPGGRTMLAGDLADARVREVEVHHADLGLDHTTADWPPAFVVVLLDARRALHTGTTGFTAHAVDLDRSWTFGTGGPTVSGPGAALAWWAAGRGSGEGLTSDDGQLPRIEAW